MTLICLDIYAHQSLAQFVMRYTLYSIITERIVSKIEKRRRRGKSKEMIILDTISLNQTVPVVQEYSWLSSISKTFFQAFYFEWLSTNSKESKPLYLGISPQAWLVSAGCASPFPILNWTHKEADNRMMILVKDVLSPVRTYIHDTVIRWHRCLFVSVISYNSQLEGSQPPRALAHL